MDIYKDCSANIPVGYESTIVPTGACICTQTPSTPSDASGTGFDVDPNELHYFTSKDCSGSPIQANMNGLSGTGPLRAHYDSFCQDGYGEDASGQVAAYNDMISAIMIVPASGCTPAA